MGVVRCPGILLHKRGRQGCLLETFKITLRGIKSSALWVWLEIFSHQKRYQFSNKTLSPVIFSRRNTRPAIGGTAKALAVDILRLNNLRGSKTAFYP